MSWLQYLILLYVISTMYVFLSKIVFEKSFKNNKDLNGVLFFTFIPIVNSIAFFILLFDKFKSIIIHISLYFEQKRNEKYKVKSYEGQYQIYSYGKYFYIRSRINDRPLKNDFINKKKLLKQLLECNGFTDIINNNHIVLFDNLQDAKKFLEILESRLVLEKLELY